MSISTKMELLAPAGTFAAFAAALEEGADAVYVGAPGFNARALAKGLSFSEIKLMVDSAKKEGRKIYIAMNSLIKEEEIPLAIESLSIFSQMRPHGLIVQDIGLHYLARNYFPGLPLHASTLMSVHNSMAAKWLVKQGFERVVLARELTIKEIKTIYRQTGARLEVFIHGAMCFSYSGLCLFSSLHGGKSSLRGRCVQPCRRRYGWAGRKNKRKTKGRGGCSGYLFSMHDLCGINLLAELRAAGVVSVKIEGRLKSAEYVRKVVRAYRMALDAMDLPSRQRLQVLAEAHLLLDNAMGRRRSSGYLKSSSPTTVITPSVSGTSGLRIGRALRIIRKKEGRTKKDERLLEVELLQSVTVGDRLRFHDERSGERFAFTLRSLLANGEVIKKGNRGQKVHIPVPINFLQTVAAGLGGSLYKIDVSGRRNAERIISRRQHGLKKRRVGPDLRKVRQVLAALGFKQQKQAAKSAHNNYPQQETVRHKKRNLERLQATWWVKVSSFSDIDKRMVIKPRNIIVPLSRENFLQAKKLAGRKKRFLLKVVWALPPVIFEQDQGWFQNNILQLVSSEYKAFQLGHLSQLELFTALPAAMRKDLLLYGDYTFNLLNSLSLRAVAAMKISAVQFSLESDWENLRAGISRFHRFHKSKESRNRLVIGFLVYGKIPLFTARLESDHLPYNKAVISPKNEMYIVERQEGLTRVRAKMPLSRLQNLKELRGAGIDYMMLDLSGGRWQNEAAAVTSLLQKTKGRSHVLSGNFYKKLL